MPCSWSLLQCSPSLYIEPTIQFDPIIYNTTENVGVTVTLRLTANRPIPGRTLVRVVNVNGTGFGMSFITFSLSLSHTHSLSLSLSHSLSLSLSLSLSFSLFLPYLFIWYPSLPQLQMTMSLLIKRYVFMRELLNKPLWWTLLMMMNLSYLKDFKHGSHLWMEKEYGLEKMIWPQLTSMMMMVWCDHTSSCSISYCKSHDHSNQCMMIHHLLPFHSTRGTVSTGIIQYSRGRWYGKSGGSHEWIEYSGCYPKHTYHCRISHMYAVN